MESSQALVKPVKSERVLVIMAKAPRGGNVKTRLMQALPVEAVTELYRSLLCDTISLACSLRDVNLAIMCPASDVEELSALVDVSTPVVAQHGIGLAAALTSVFTQFAASGKQRVIAFNSDSPHLPGTVIEGAFDLLLAHDVVVGPTHDGGYYLVGANAIYPELFRADGMGTNTALDTLLARARKLQLSVAFTEPFYDIDLEDDLARLATELRLAPERAPRTAEWLKQWQRMPSELTSAAGDL